MTPTERIERASRRGQPVTPAARGPMIPRYADVRIPPAAAVYDPFAQPLPVPPPGVLPAARIGQDGRIAMDWSNQVGQVWQWAMQGAFQEGLGFLGYPYLAQLTQRAEYRRISEIIAKEMTRKWIKVTATGDAKADKVKAMDEALRKYNVQDLFRQAAEVDGFFGRSQLYIDTGTDERKLGNPLVISDKTIKTGCLKGFQLIEPLWSYPGAYDSTNPLSPAFYKPDSWYVNGQTIHASRLLTFVKRELPDILKPAYQFGGLSMSQMAKPYVDNWLRTRQSVSDLLHSFSVMVLATDLSTILQSPDAAQSLIARAQLFNQIRDNRGLMMVNKDDEELTNVAAPLGSLDHLQAQAQEQMASVAGVPLVILLGITPSGLNASSDGEIRTFYASVLADQEQFFRPKLQRVFEVIQLSEFGSLDPGLSFAFNPLWESDESEDAAARKAQADTDAVYIAASVIDPEEVRERLAGDDESPYHGLDLSKTIEPPIPPGTDPADEGDPDAEPDLDAETQAGEGSHELPGAGDLAAVSLNGAQVTSMVDIVTKVATGELPVPAALAILTTAFPIDATHAKALLSGITPGSLKREPPPGEEGDPDADEDPSGEPDAEA